MPVAPACPIVLTAAERKRLKKMAYGHKSTEHRLRRRAQSSDTRHAARGTRHDVRGWPARAGRVRRRQQREDLRPNPLPLPSDPGPGPGPGDGGIHAYGRRAAPACLAAYDVHRAKVFGRCEPKTGVVPSTALGTQLMAQEPYASATRVFWIVDNGSSHRGKKAIYRLTGCELRSGGCDA
ncbi:hypothetical protein ACFWDQ_32970 [Streptomyces sp. NPDC060053]|uniref:hypothetical protein n=1 Tax=Streptomyces sp. NPDC060053 TaxID=3347047 RepID=UPI00368D2310